MEIIIVGGGMAGLTAYLSLKKHLPSSETQDITIYERHSASEISDPRETRAAAGHSEPPDRIVVGGGLGVGPNGMRVLKYLSADLHARVTAAGFAVTSYELRTSANSVLGQFPAGADQPTKQDAVMTSWRTLWEEIRKEVPAHGVLMTGKKVSAVESQGVVVFDNGERLQADLVIGADGAKSICRRAVLKDGETGDAEFQGLVGFGGFVPTAELPAVAPSASEVIMTFGPKGFFGYSPCSTSPESKSDRPTPGDSTMWWSTWASSTPQCPAPFSPESRKRLHDLHGDWTNPVIRHIIENATPELSTPTWTVPKLPRWCKGKVILIGDAAHALPSTSGQGVSQAFEDVVTLGMLLGAALEMSSDHGLGEAMLGEAAQRYEKLRKSRVEGIRDEAVRMQGKKREMKWWELWMMYSFMWLALSVFKNNAGAKANEYNAKDVADAEVKNWKSTVNS